MTLAHQLVHHSNPLAQHPTHITPRSRDLEERQSFKNAQRPANWQARDAALTVYPSRASKTPPREYPPPHHQISISHTQDTTDTNTTTNLHSLNPTTTTNYFSDTDCETDDEPSYYLTREEKEVLSHTPSTSSSGRLTAAAEPEGLRLPYQPPSSGPGPPDSSRG